MRPVPQMKLPDGPVASNDRKDRPAAKRAEMKQSMEALISSSSTLHRGVFRFPPAEVPYVATESPQGRIRRLILVSDARNKALSLQKIRRRRSRICRHGFHDQGAIMAARCHCYFGAIDIVFGECDR